MGPTEVHAFVLWPKSLAEHERILADIASRFTILEVLRIAWSDAAFSRNLSRFYSSKLPPGSDKERHCGRGDFLLVVVRDEEPEHGPRPTSKGLKDVDAKMFDARAEYRKQTGGGHRVHGTLTAAEAEHDLFLLLGFDADSYGPGTPPWNGTIRTRARDLAGEPRWHSEAELFRALNVTACCVSIAQDDVSNDPLVVLTDNLWDAIMVANGRARSLQGRVVHEVAIDGPSLTLDLVQLGTGYLDPRWEQEIVSRALAPGAGIRRATAEDRLYVALYGRFVRGEDAPDDDVLRALAQDAVVDLRSLAAPEALLDAFLARHGYERPPWQPPELDFDSGFFVPLPALAGQGAAVRPVLGRRMRNLLPRGRSRDVKTPESRARTTGAKSAVTAVVVSYNTRELLETCVSELGGRGLPTIVVDNASSDGSVAAVRRRFPAVDTIELGTNRGFGAAANEGIRRAQTPYVMLLNADAWPSGDPMPDLVALADADDRLGAVAPTLITEDGSTQRSVFGYPRHPATLAAWAAMPRGVSLAFTLWRRLGDVARAAPAHHYRLLLPGDFPSGAALLLRKQAVEEVGGFDERFFMYSEETDLCERLQEAGWRVAQHRASRFIHVGGASTRQHLDEMRREQLLSYLRFMAKHSGVHTARRAKRLTAAALRIRAAASSTAGRRVRCETAAWLEQQDVAKLL